MKKTLSFLIVVLWTILAFLLGLLLSTLYTQTDGMWFIAFLLWIGGLGLFAMLSRLQPSK